MRKLRVAVALAAAATLGLAACGSPSSNNESRGGGGTNETQQKLLDPDAKGPAPEVPGARKGGTITVYSQSTPNTFDPTDIYYVDSNEIGKLVFRTPTQFATRKNQPVLVPDLTDLGTPSADGLSWTFKLKQGLKYQDGTEIKAADLAYAVKRSFAHDVFVNGPAYQLEFFKDGDKYKGPYTGGLDYSGVETPDDYTLVIHLAKPFPDLPFYLSFPAFTPIPQAKDTKDNYKNNPIATGPYQFAGYNPGAELKLVKNPNWDANSDPVRHQYVDGWVFKWGQDDIKTQQSILNGAGSDANAVNYASVDSTLVPQLNASNQAQLITGPGVCTIVFQLDVRKMPIEVRKAVAMAYPYDQHWTAAGLNDYTASRASTILPPSIPGYKKYELPGLNGTGKGDPAAAKKMLETAGKVGFELSWYYANDSAPAQQVTEIRRTAFEAAGFKVKPIGVPTAQLRTVTNDYSAPVNMGQAPAGWCSDWPSGSTWMPVLNKSRSVDDGSSFGMIQDPKLDAEIDAISALPAAEASAKWAALDEKIMRDYLPVLPRYYDKTAVLVGKNVGGGSVDVTMGMPNFLDMFLKG